MDGQYSVFDQMQKNLGIQRLTTEEEFQNYLAYKQEDQMNAIQAEKNARQKEHLQKDSERHEILRNQIIDMLMIDESSAEQLGTAFRLEAGLAKSQTAAMQKDADVSGVAKLKHDFFGSKRRAAKRNLNLLKMRQQQLAVIRAQKGQVALKREEYVPADGNVKLIQKDVKDGFKYNPLHGFGTAIVTGSRKERRDGKEFVHYGCDALEEDVQIPTAKGVLCGRIYKPVKNVTGKVAIVITGRGGSNAYMSPNLSASYLAAGAAVVCVDMRGFGSSYSVDKEQKRTGTYLSAAGMYADAREIYDYVKANMAGNTSDIIIHGYSLGGAVATKLAADIAAENAQKLAQGKTVTEKDRLGGLVLSSPADKFSNALSHTVGSSKVGIVALATGLGEVAKGIAYTTVGGLNTDEHLRTLHKYDPNIPVMFTSGEAKFDDFLSLEATQLNHVKGAEFRNSTSETGMHGHEAVIGKKVDGKMQPSEKIVRMVKYGRGADLVSPVQKEAIRIDGLPQSGQTQMNDTDAMKYALRYVRTGYLITDPQEKEVYHRGIRLCMKQGIADVGASHNGMQPEKIAIELMHNEKGFAFMRHLRSMINETAFEKAALQNVNQKLPLSLASGGLSEEKVKSNAENVNQIISTFETEMMKSIKGSPDVMQLIKDFTQNIADSFPDLSEEQRRQVAGLFISKALMASISDKTRQIKDGDNKINDPAMAELISTYYTTTTTKHLGYLSSLDQKTNDAQKRYCNSREKKANAVYKQKYGMQLDDGESERLKQRLSRIDDLLYGK